MNKQILLPILALCFLGGAIYLTLFLISPPAPLSVDAPGTAFSAGRAMEDLEVIAREPHPIGVSPAHGCVRDYLLGEIHALGLEPQVQDTFGLRLWGPASGYISGGFVENILVRLRGTNPEGAILLSSHYDSTPGGPGGADSGSGVVTILEILRALRAGPPLRQDVIIIFFDGEEPGTFGAHAFVAQHPWFVDVRFVVNMDMFRAGPPMLVSSSQGNGMLIQALARTSSKPAYISFPFDLIPTETDFLPFAQTVVPGAEIDAGGLSTKTHTALDRPDDVDPRSLQQAGDQMLAMVRYLGDRPALGTNIPDQTFFPVMGMLVHYPVRLAWAFAVVAGLCFLGMIIYGFRKAELTWRGLGLGFLVFLLSLVLSVVLVNLIWRCILAFHPEYAYVSFSWYRPQLSDDFLYAVGFIVLALAVVISSIAVARKRISTFNLAAGALVIWFPLTIATTILVPATSYMLTWVLLAGSLALLLAIAVRSKKNSWILSGLSFLASGLLAIFLWIPLFYITILMGPMGPGFPLLSMLIVLVAIWLGSMTPILDWITSLKRWLLPAAALLGALSFLVAGHFLVGKDSPPPLVNPVGYWLDADEREAYWVAFSDRLDERQANLLVNPIRRPYTELLSEAPQQSVLTNAAPMLDLDGPRLEVISDEWNNNRRVVDISFSTSMHDRLYIIIPKEAPLAAITVPNNEKTEVSPVDNRSWVLRFDGMPIEGIDIRFEFSKTGSIQFLLVEEKTGLPSFPGVVTQPEPGTMKSPGEFYQSIPTDFTAICRSYIVQELGPK